MLVYEAITTGPNGSYRAALAVSLEIAQRECVDEYSTINWTYDEVNSTWECVDGRYTSRIRAHEVLEK